MNMNKKSICIFFAVFVLLLSGVFLWQQFDDNNEKEEKKAVLIPEDREEEKEDADSFFDEEIPVHGTVEETRYYLVVEDGYLSVYQGKDTFYAYTDIRYDELDEMTKEEIRKGLSFADERTLYDFLENHSS